MTIALQNYSTYSHFSGVKLPKHYLKAAAEFGVTAFGITEKQTMGSHIEYAKALRDVDADIKLLYGAELVMVPDASEKEPGFDKTEIILFAKDEQGYRNLIALNNISATKVDHGGGYYYLARTDQKMLAEHSHGLICIAPENGAFRYNEDMSEVLNLTELMTLRGIFGDDFYLGINPLHDDERKVDFSSPKLDFQVCMTHNSHVPREDELDLYPFIRQVGRHGSKTAALDREHVTSLESAAKMDVPDYLKKGTQEIVDKCNFKVSFDEVNMPQVFLDGGSVEADLIHRVALGFKKKLNHAVKVKEITCLEDLRAYADSISIELKEQGIQEEDMTSLDVYVDRLIYEYGIVKSLGFESYFHIVEKVCRYIDERDADRGAGRGSAGGSLLSYLLNITKVDPIYHKLSFERFLNPDRNDLPDIDLDFSEDARALALEYLRDNYGKDRVVSIGSYGRWKVAGSIKDACRAFGRFIPVNGGGPPAQYTDYYLSSILKDESVTQTARGRAELDERLQRKSFKDFYDKHSEWIEKFIMPLQDTISNNTVHPCGYLILPKDLNDCMPVRFNSNKGHYTTLWQDRDCEDIGYPKFDFLIVDAINVASYAKKLARSRGHEVPEFERVSLTDEGVVEFFKHAFTKGIFQFKTSSQSRYLRKLKPESFEHLVASVALIRPGPMEIGADYSYQRIKNGKAEPEIIHDDLEGILGVTYGLPIFQEQIMAIAREIAGFSGSEADYLRKAVGKKKLDKLKKWEGEFKSRSIERGYPQEMADDLWNTIMAFGGYGFNLSHSVCYTLLSWYQMYLKVYHPQEFWCACLKYATETTSSDNSVFALKAEAERDGMKFIWPTINSFAADFEPVGDDTIVWPLKKLKYISSKATDALCKDGRRSFSSLEEMLESVTKGEVNKRVMASLIMSGFFDPIGKPWEVGPIIEEARGCDFDLDWDDENSYLWQRRRNEVFRFQISSWKDALEDDFPVALEEMTSRKFAAVEDGEKVVLGGRLDSLEILQTKRGDPYAKAFIEDLDGRHRVMFWADYWDDIELDKSDRRPRNDDIIMVCGKKSSFTPKDQEEGRSKKTFHSVQVGKYESVTIIKRG